MCGIVGVLGNHEAAPILVEALRRLGRAAGLLGPMCTSDQLVQWLTRAGLGSVTLEMSGALGYFRGVREA